MENEVCKERSGGASINVGSTAVPLLAIPAPYLDQQLKVHIVTLRGGAVGLLVSPTGNKVDSLSI